MQVHLVDGTYELFRYHFALPSHITAKGAEVAATRGVVGTCFQLLEGGATHVGIATDHVIESFRNDLWATYKDGSGIPVELKSQFPLIEEALGLAGFTVWPMVEFEADDALGAAAQICADDPAVDLAIICTPDKDLGQCVVDGRVVQLDRRKEVTYDVAGVTAKFGVGPESIADYLALVGDTADGFPGLPGWGAKSAAAVLARYVHLEDIPLDAKQWDVDVRAAGKLAATLAANLDDALLFRTVATIRTDAFDHEPGVSLDAVADMEWTGPHADFELLCDLLEAPGLWTRATKLAAAR